jgi:rhodanese-related sulfurtransferase
MIRGPRLLALVAAVAALAAGFAGDAPPRRAGEVSAVRVAEWLRERRAVRIYDVRERSAHDMFAVPAAEHITLAALAALPFEPTDTVVVYGARNDAAVVRAWEQLRERGVDASYLLRGGVDEWVADVLNPTLSATASPEDEAAFERVAELSRYFGGVPRRTAPADAPPDANAATPAGDAATQIEAVIRRGC